MPRFTTHAARLSLSLSIQSSSSSSSSSYGFVVMEDTGGPLISCVPTVVRGLKILVVDHDTTSLMYIASMLEQYSYKVATTELASVALSMIRNQKDRFHLVMANTNMPDMDIVTFLRRIKDDMPVILMSSNRDVNLAKKALCQGACFFLEKPISLEDLKYVWQHAYSKRSFPVKETRRVNCEKESQGRKVKEVDRLSRTATRNDLHGVYHKRVITDPKGKNKQIEGESSLVGGNHVGKSLGESKRKRSNEEKEGKRKETNSEQINSKHKNPIEKEGRERKDDNSSSAEKKSPRMLWNSDLHLKFTAALSVLGDENARPKTILEMMNVPNLTQRQIASHLQKYKAQVQRISESCDTDPPLSQSIVPKSTSSLCDRNGFSHQQEQHCSVECPQGSGTSNFGMVSPGLYVENSVQHNLTTPNHKPHLINYPHSYCTTKYNQVQMESYGELHGFNQMRKEGMFSNDISMNEYEKEKHPFGLPAPFCSQNADKHSMAFAGLTQEPDFVPGLAPPAYSLNQNQPPTDNDDFMKVLKEMEELGDFCSNPNTGDVDGYCEWLNEALDGNSTHPPQF